MYVGPRARKHDGVCFKEEFKRCLVTLWKIAMAYKDHEARAKCMRRADESSGADAKNKLAQESWRQNVQKKKVC